MKLRLITLAFISVFFLTAASAKKKTTAPVNDRQQWVELCYRIAAPVLENMSKGELQKNMQLELSPTWDGRDKRVAYMETFGRLMAGISPWLALPDDDTEEGKMRKQMREWACLQKCRRSRQPRLLIVGNQINTTIGRCCLYSRKFPACTRSHLAVVG